MKTSKSLIERDLELKFPVASYRVGLILDLLRHFCLPDRNYAENDVYTLYYDTKDFDAYYENVYGDNVKAKLRIRWYGDRSDLNEDFFDAFIEIKSKEGLRIRKVRKRVHLSNASFKDIKKYLKDDAWMYQLKGVSTELGWRNYNALFPVILIKYKRYRFIDPLTGKRISLDTEISGISINNELLPTAQPAKLDVAVIEIKGGNKPPVFFNMVKGINFWWERFSKYSACLDACLGQSL